MIRDAVESYLHSDAQNTAVRRMLDGYRRTPETPDEMAIAEASARALVDEEPW